jgi:hypothetical protein
LDCASKRALPQALIPAQSTVRRRPKDSGARVRTQRDAVSGVLTPTPTASCRKYRVYAHQQSCKRYTSVFSVSSSAQPAPTVAPATAATNAQELREVSQAHRTSHPAPLPCMSMLMTIVVLFKLHGVGERRRLDTPNHVPRMCECVILQLCVSVSQMRCKRTAYISKHFY